MKIIKEYVKRNDGGYRLAVWTNTYVCTLEHIMTLCDVLLEVDPDLRQNDIDVEKYGGDTYRGMTAVECNTNIEPDSTWLKTNQLEYTL